VSLRRTLVCRKTGEAASAASPRCRLPGEACKFRTDCVIYAVDEESRSEAPREGDNGMPIFDYRCTQCGEVVEVLERPGERRKHRCAKCGSGKLEKLLSAFGLRSSADASCSRGQGRFT